MAKPTIFCLFVVIMCLSHPTKCQAQDYVIDTLVVLDTPALNTWIAREPPTMTLGQKTTAATAKIKEYISFVIRQANQRLDTLDDQWTVKLSVTGFNIGADPLQVVVHPLSKSVSAEKALEVMQLWVVNNGHSDQFDYVILMTGYSLEGTDQGDFDIKGIANIGTLCSQDGTSVSLVEDRGGLQSSFIVAHEMGHSLGAKHDGESPNTACPGQDRFLMAGKSYTVTSSNKANPWEFSQCSKNVISANLMDGLLKNYRSCLQDSQTPSSEFKATEGLLVGQTYDADRQCQQMYGTDSRLCLGNNFGELDGICTSMYCLNPAESTRSLLKCHQHSAAEGTSCANGKLCQMGRCVENPRAPTDVIVDPTCPYGDSIVTIEGGLTCSEYIAQSPYACYDSQVQKVCCGSCTKLKSKSEACPYGDRRTGCSADICNMHDKDGTPVEQLCCRTCGYDVIQTCRDVDSIDGLTCDRRAFGQFWQGCYNTTVAYQCCKTCRGVRTEHEGCEYGDVSVSPSCRSLVPDVSQCVNHGTQCCHTCRQLQGNGAGSISLPWLLCSATALLLASSSSSSLLSLL